MIGYQLDLITRLKCVTFLSRFVDGDLSLTLSANNYMGVHVI